MGNLFAVYHKGKIIFLGKEAFAHTVAQNKKAELLKLSWWERDAEVAYIASYSSFASLRGEKRIRKNALNKGLETSIALRDASL